MVVYILFKKSTTSTKESSIIVDIFRVLGIYESFGTPEDPFPPDDKGQLGQLFLCSLISSSIFRDLCSRFVLGKGSSLII